MAELKYTSLGKPWPRARADRIRRVDHRTCLLIIGLRLLLDPVGLQAKRLGNDGPRSSPPCGEAEVAGRVAGGGVRPVAGMLVGTALEGHLPDLSDARPAKIERRGAEAFASAIPARGYGS